MCRLKSLSISLSLVIKFIISPLHFSCSASLNFRFLGGILKILMPLLLLEELQPLIKQLAPGIIIQISLMISSYIQTELKTG